MAVPQHRRDRLEHLCRYITRPALCLERLSLHTDGRIRLRLKRPFRDGTTHLLFTPADFIARLAAHNPHRSTHRTAYFLLMPLALGSAPCDGPLKRVFEIDITLCPRCGGQLRVIADITEPELITKILDRIQNRDPPRKAPRRAPANWQPNDLFAEP